MNCAEQFLEVFLLFFSSVFTFASVFSPFSIIGQTEQDLEFLKFVFQDPKYQNFQDIEHHIGITFGSGKNNYSGEKSRGLEFLPQITNTCVQKFYDNKDLKSCICVFSRTGICFEEKCKGSNC